MRARAFGRLGCVVLIAVTAGSCSAEDAESGRAVEEGGKGEAKKVEWNRPRSEERADERRGMVDRQIAGRRLDDKKVLGAMRSVPRHWFVPDSLQRAAYWDRPLPIGHGQTISQPYIVAKMTALLKVAETHKVLEIGTGSGYQAAVLNELTPNVCTIEIIKTLASSAAKRLKDRGYAGVKTKTGDGYYGWPDEGPFDAIIVTAAAGHVPAPLLKQLKRGGRMVIPVGAPFRVQQLMLITKDAKGKLTSRIIAPVRFVPLTGGPRRGN